MTSNTLLSLPVTKQKSISASTVFKKDIVPWLASSVLAMLAFLVVSLIIASANPDVDGVDARVVLFGRATIFYWVLIIGACFMARRSKSAWTWVLSAVLIFLFLPQIAPTLATTLFPHSILQSLIAMLGLLALGRLVEYLYIRYHIKLAEPTLSTRAIVLYAIVCLVSFFFCSSFLYRLILS